jgi:type II secretory pathway component HofQ
MEQHPEELSEQELAAESGQELPDREAMSTISADFAGIENFAMPINEAIAINNQSIQSIAIADADQTVIIGQVDTDAEPTP